MWNLKPWLAAAAAACVVCLSAAPLLHAADPTGAPIKIAASKSLSFKASKAAKGAKAKVAPGK